MWVDRIWGFHFWFFPFHYFPSRYISHGFFAFQFLVNQQQPFCFIFPKVEKKFNLFYSLPLLLSSTFFTGLYLLFVLILYEFYTYFSHLHLSGGPFLCYYWKQKTTGVIFIQQFPHTHPKFWSMLVTNGIFPSHEVFFNLCLQS